MLCGLGEMVTFHCMKSGSPEDEGVDEEDGGLAESEAKAGHPGSLAGGFGWRCQQAPVQFQDVGLQREGCHHSNAGERLGSHLVGLVIQFVGLHMHSSDITIFGALDPIVTAFTLSVKLWPSQENFYNLCTQVWKKALVMAFVIERHRYGPEGLMQVIGAMSTV